MPSEIPFRIALALTLLAFVAHRGYYHRKHHAAADLPSGKNNTGPFQFLTNLLGFIALVSTIIYLVLPGWLLWFSLPLPTGFRWSGVVIALLGFGLLHWSQDSLGRNWSDAPHLKEGHTLIQAGPYRWIRHPIYTSFLLILGSPLLITANLAVGSSWLIMTALEVRDRIRLEEAVMISHFGEEYRAYKNRAGCLLPRWPGAREL